MSRAPRCLTRVESTGGVLLLSVPSEHLRDVASVSLFERELRDLAATHTELRWILDFADRTFFLTPAVNTLLSIMRNLRQRGGDLVLTGVTQDVRYVLRLLRLDNIFAVYPSVVSARSALVGEDDVPPAAEAI